MLILCITQHSPSNTHFYPANELLLKIKIKCHACTFSFWIDSFLVFFSLKASKTNGGLLLLSLRLSLKLGVVKV